MPAERLPWLVARSSGAWQVALIVGPVLGGVLYAVTPAASYPAMAGLLAVAAISIFAVEVPPRPGRPDTRAGPGVEGSTVGEGHPIGALEGVQFIRSHELVLGAISLDLFAVLFGGAIALLPAIAETASAPARSVSVCCAPRTASAPRSSRLCSRCGRCAATSAGPC